MSTSIPELIAVELVTRLETITTGNGFFSSVASVTRVDRLARNWTPKNLSIAVSQPADTRNPQLDHEGNPPAQAHDLAFLIHCFVRQPDDPNVRDLTTENAFAAAVHKAVAGTSDWHTFNGNAFNADWGQRQAMLNDEGKHTGATLPLVVQYRVSETDPFTSRA